VPNDHVTLIKNPRFYDAQHVRLRMIIYKPTQDAIEALKLIRAGEIDTQNSVPAAEIDWMRAHLKRALQIGPFFGSLYVIVNF